jgi:hypothetical protein
MCLISSWFLMHEFFLSCGGTTWNYGKLFNGTIDDDWNDELELTKEITLLKLSTVPKKATIYAWLNWWSKT